MATATKKKLTGKKLASAVEAAFYRHGANRKYPILDLRRIQAAGERAYGLAASPDAGLVAIDRAVAAACDRYEAEVPPQLVDALDDALEAAILGELDEVDAPFDFAIPGLATTA